VAGQHHLHHGEHRELGENHQERLGHQLRDVGGAQRRTRLEVPDEHRGGQHDGARVEGHPEAFGAGVPGQREPVQGVHDDRDGDPVDREHERGVVHARHVREADDIDGLLDGGDADQGHDDAQVPPEAPRGGHQPGRLRGAPIHGGEQDREHRGDGPEGRLRLLGLEGGGEPDDRDEGEPGRRAQARAAHQAQQHGASSDASSRQDGRA
jgi:hypothetical protein